MKNKWRSLFSLSALESEYFKDYIVNSVLKDEIRANALKFFNANRMVMDYIKIIDNPVGYKSTQKFQTF